MSASDLAADRAELLRRPTALERARKELANAERIRAKYGEESYVTPAQLEKKRRRVEHLERMAAAEPPAESPGDLERADAPAAPTLIHLAEPVRIGVSGSLLVVGFFSDVPKTDLARIGL